MDKFKPLTIDDFDSKFLSNTAVEPVREEPRPFIERDSLIPDIAIEQPGVEEPKGFFGNNANDGDNIISFPVEVLPEDNAKSYSNVKPFPAARQTSNFESRINFEDYPEEPAPEKKSKRSAGNLAAKIGIIVLLAATLVSFVFGCFISMFIDNPSTDIRGYTFCTMKIDVMQPMLSEGDMIIVKKAAPKDYVNGRLIAFNSAGYDGCRVHIVGSSSQMVYADEYQIITTGYDGETAATATISSNDVIGIVAAYIPNVGGVLSFAMNNAILVCALYLLLVVFWGLLLVLVERTKD